MPNYLTVPRQPQADPRMRLFCDRVATILNALLRAGIVVQTGQTAFEVVNPNPASSQIGAVVFSPRDHEIARSLLAEDAFDLQHVLANRVFRQRGELLLSQSDIPDFTGGGGSGAPTTSKYVLTAADGSLANARVLPYLANYSPDILPASPSAQDDEFTAGSISGSWTSVGPPTTLESSTFAGFARIGDASGSTVGMYEAFTPGANAFTVVCKVHYLVSAGFSFVGMQVTDSANTGLGTITLQNDGVGQARARTGPAGGTNVTLVGYWVASTAYLRIQRNSTTSYQIDVSQNGILWATVNNFVQAGTVARIHLQVNGQSATTAYGVFDFVRTFSSQTDIIGRAP